LLDLLHADDTLVVNRIDGLAPPLQAIDYLLKTGQGPESDDRHPHRRRDVLDMLGVFAEFETNPRRARQLGAIDAGAGIARWLRGLFSSRTLLVASGGHVGEPAGNLRSPAPG
jgi:hypothetical protein